MSGQTVTVFDYRLRVIVQPKAKVVFSVGICEILLFAYLNILVHRWTLCYKKLDMVVKSS